MYAIKGGRNPVYGIPLMGVKLCAVSACKFIEGIFMTQALGSFHILDENGMGLIPITSKTGPTMDERPVRIGKGLSKVADMRYRGRFDDWALTFKIMFNPRAISIEQIANLYENAGFSIGLCEYRPEKRGPLGMFEGLKWK